MDDIERQLSSFGLNDKEIKVYMACIQLGTDTAFNIARRSGIKRATTYLVLSSLVGRGLVMRRATPKALLFSATNPEGLLSQLEVKKKEFEAVLPSLLAIYNSQPEKPSIQIFEGVDGVNRVYQEAIEFLRNDKDVIFYGDISYLKNHPILLKSWLKETRSARGHIRELFSFNAFHEEYARKVKENENSMHEVRMLQSRTDVFLSDNALFGNKLIIFSTQKNLFAIVIENKEVVATYKTMFELAWDTSKK